MTSPPATSKARALFLDRDGVINHEAGYLYRSGDVRWVDGIFTLAQTAVRLEYRLIVVTNQSGIARGLYTEADFHSLMNWMRTEFVVHGAPLDAVYFCPYHPEHGVGGYKRDHEDRKPGPGMLLRAALDLDLDLSTSVLVGDRCSDIAAANAAGVREAFLLSGTEAEPCPGKHRRIESLEEIRLWLLQHF
jgi:D-glycero-D-manno-heptose 1,7-bisphosphate phosphatase